MKTGQLASKFNRGHVHKHTAHIHTHTQADRMGSRLKRCKLKGIHKIRDLLGYYTAKSGNSLLMFWENLPVPSSRVLDFLTLEDGTVKKSRNISKELSRYAAYPSTVQISSTLWWKQEITQSIHTLTKCTNVETIAQRSILCSADSSHSNGRYWIREPEYGLIANPTRSTMNESTYKTCI